MIAETIRTTLLREVRALRRQVEAYANEEQLWTVPAGIPNSAGTLVLHLAGNLQHYIGARLGGTSYVRERELEFSRRNVSRAELLEEIAAAESAVAVALDVLSDDELRIPYPESFFGATIPTGAFLIHLSIHLGYHLGQVDYHRRVVTGDSTSLDAIAIRELPSI